MALILADAGAVKILERFLNNNFPTDASNNILPDLTLKLFVNDKIPADTDAAADYTEASGGGYAAKTLTAGGWTVSINPNGIAEAVYPQQTFTFTGPLTGNATVYGYYIVDANGTLMWAERFAQPFTPANNGDEIRLTPKIQLSKGTPT